MASPQPALSQAWDPGCQNWVASSLQGHATSFFQSGGESQDLPPHVQRHLCFLGLYSLLCFEPSRLFFYFPAAELDLAFSELISHLIFIFQNFVDTPLMAVAISHLLCSGISISFLIPLLSLYWGIGESQVHSIRRFCSDFQHLCIWISKLSNIEIYVVWQISCNCFYYFWLQQSRFHKT